MSVLWFDSETYSEANLFSVGTPRYAEHPSTEIIVVQWAVDDDAPTVVDVTGRQVCPQLIDLLQDPSMIITAQNSFFDRTLLRCCWGLDLPPERWYDVMIQALAHGLPGALEKLGQVLGLPIEEQKKARDTMHLFCKPMPKNRKLRRATSHTHPAEWADFLEYSGQDIVTMRAVSKRMPNWNYKPGHPELALWHLDQRINDRGFQIDVPFAQAMVATVEVEQDRLRADMHEATDGAVESASQRDKLMKHLLEEHGVTLPDMTADTLKRRVDDVTLPDGVRLLLRIRLEATKASTSKYEAALRTVSDDGRMRATLQFCGAQRTGRWAGRGLQPQNLLRPDEQHILNFFALDRWPKDDAVVDALVEEYERCAVMATIGGYAPIVFDNVMQLSANMVRGMIISAPGKKLVIGDLANIEGRYLAWLAGEAWKLKAFRAYDAGTGPDLYKVAYGRSFAVDPSEAVGMKRQIGKVQELGLGYEGGVGAFITFSAVYNMDLEEMANGVWSTASAEAIEEAEGMLEWTRSKKRSTYGLSDRVYIACEVLKASWRRAHPAITALWKALSEAVKDSMCAPGQVFRVGPLAIRTDGMWLRIRMPSGRYLCYLQPTLTDKGEITYLGVNPYTRQWCRLKTYGGKLAENVTQAGARDVLSANMEMIDDDAGYPIVLHSHDELVTEPPDDPSFSVERLTEMMTINPPWALDLPLAAAGFESYRYRK